MEFNSKFKPNCSMLIDQEKYIGGDPIGHTCFNIAEYQDNTHFYCAECRDKLIRGDMSITKPNFNFVLEWEALCKRYN